MKGIIKQFFESKGFGFIATENGDELYFRTSYMVNQAKPIKGASVGFKKKKCAKGFEARNIIYLHEDGAVSAAIDNKAVFKEISRWKLDAKLEDMCRYFYVSKEYESIVSKEKHYLIGRKGNGKTAICNRICSESKHDVFCIKLSFKNFPFNNLYSLSDDGYSAPNQYITLWKYVIYSNICKLMTENEGVDLDVRNELEAIFQPTLKKTLAKEIGEWTRKGFKIKLPGLEINSEHKNVDNHSNSWTDRVEVLEKVIFEEIDQSDYFVLFDELDEDYSSSAKESNSRYMDLLMGLFKAVQDIVSKSQERNKHLAPVIFIRDDIYNNIKGGSDKTKWSDFREEIYWDTHSIKGLLAHRINRAHSNEEAKLSFDEAWYSIFEPELLGKKEKLHLFDFIENLSLGRPRDYIHYLKLCADSALKYSLGKINARAVKAAEIAFSSYLRSEFEDELHVEVENIHEVFNILSSINRNTFTAEQFFEVYSVECGSNNVHSAHEVLYTLYKFGVIGYYSSSVSNFQISVLNHPDSILNIGKKLYVHRGLYKALQVY